MREFLAAFALVLGYITASDSESLPDAPPPPPQPKETMVWLADRGEWVPLREAPKASIYDQTPSLPSSIRDGFRVMQNLQRERIYPSVPCTIYPHPALYGTAHVRNVVCPL
jgi:hypothetical protein